MGYTSDVQGAIVFACAVETAKSDPASTTPASAMAKPLLLITFCIFILINDSTAKTPQ